jgi:hypothetical protein
MGHRPFAGSKSRKQPFDACRCQRPADRPLLMTSNGYCRPKAETRSPRLPTAKLTVIGYEATHAAQQGPR